MGQYFENDTNLSSNKRVINYYINDNKLSFVSDNGVFSNDNVDYGSSFLIKQILKQNKVNSLLDLGCGYGVIGLTLKHFNFTNYLDLIDINERAVELTKENIALLKLDSCNAFVSNGFENIKTKYDLILFNPPIRAGKQVIYKIYEDSINYLNENGKFSIVIKKSLGAESSITKLKTIYKNVEIINKDKGYYIIESYN